MQLQQAEVLSRRLGIQLLPLLRLYSAYVPRTPSPPSISPAPTLIHMQESLDS
jgi:hypothetical protein